MNPHRARTQRRHATKLGPKHRPNLVAVFEVANAESYQAQGQALRARIEKTPGRITPVSIFGWPGEKGIVALKKFADGTDNEIAVDVHHTFTDWLTEHPDDWLILGRCYVRKLKGER